MFGNAKACFWAFSLIVMSPWADFASAAEMPSTNADAGVVGAPASVPVVPEPVSVPDGHSAAEPAVQEEGQVPGVLREIGQRQTELTILELDLKRAELQKKLRELEGAAPANAPPFVAVPAAQNSNMPMLPAESGWDVQSGPLVRRIHKIGNELVAMVVFPGGETKNVRSGGVIGSGLRIVEILPDAVYVRKGDQPRYALPISTSRRGGS